METELFEQTVVKAVEDLPDEFRDLLENVDIVVTDYPDEAQRKHAGRHQTLLGLYEGVPKTARGAHYQLVLPDKITLFQKNIEAACPDPGEIPERIRSVVQHEIAHHFGMTDEELRIIERRKLTARRR